MSQTFNIARFLSVALLSFLLLGGYGVFYAFAAPSADQTVAARNFSFRDQDITIEVGDTVTWFNQGGRHNVLSTAGPASFTSGEPNTTEWVFEFTFTEPGLYEYVCEPHASIGMIGSVTVIESTGQATETPTPLPQPTAVPSSTVTATPTPSATLQPTSSLTPSPSPSPNMVETAGPTAEVSPSPSPSLSLTPDPVALDKEIFLPLIRAGIE